MILIVGSEGAGKKEYAKSLGYTDEQIADAVIDGSPVLYHLEQMVFADIDSADSLLEQASEKEVVICSEVGCGIIPADRNQRLAREATGRLQVRLAQRATAVVRVVCGIPVVIKGTL